MTPTEIEHIYRIKKERNLHFSIGEIARYVDPGSSLRRTGAMTDAKKSSLKLTQKDNTFFTHLSFSAPPHSKIGKYNE